MFPGDIGPSTGEMGTSMFFTNRSPIFDATLIKMKDKLAASGYVGYIDINCIVNSRGIYPLEFTSRFGYPHISIAMEGVLSEWGMFLYGIAKKEKPELRTKRAFQVGVVVAVPPFPFDDPTAFKRYSEDASIIFKKPNYEGIHLGDVKFVDNDWRLAGNSGYVLVVTGSGTTMEESRKIVYNRIKNIIIPNMFYRTDIGTRWVEDSDKLAMWGYF
jgi:phosphoribosylamine--glycine ligase